MAERLDAEAERRAVHRLVRVNYTIRTGAFAWCMLVIGLHGWERGYGPLFWVLISGLFLVYPHLVYLRARYAKNPKVAEMWNLYADATLLGAIVGGLQFPVWIAYAALHSTALNNIVLRGLHGAFCAVAFFCAGAALWASMMGAAFRPETSPLVTALCFLGSLGYTCAIGYVEYLQNRRLVSAREQLREGEERYRLITENAADLVALVDKSGNWVYHSPSYATLLAAKDLEEGGDAFRSLHPDDAERCRLAVLRSVATGKPRELSLRLVDREGRIRQLETRLAPTLDEQGERTRVVLVSRDVTALRESEERLLLAAHALEGMAEAILITSADGTVVTVNRAFSEITGITRDEALGRPEAELRNALQPAEFYDELYRTVRREGYWSGTTWSRRRNGSVYREWRSVRAVRDTGGNTTHYVIVFYEVGNTRAAQENGSNGSSA